jgi:hypothetical protein
MILYRLILQMLLRKQGDVPRERASFALAPERIDHMVKPAREYDHTSYLRFY